MNDLVADALRDQVKRLDGSIQWKRDNLSDWVQVASKTSKELNELVRCRRAILDHLEVNGAEPPLPDPRVWESLDDSVPDFIKVRDEGGLSWIKKFGLWHVKYEVDGWTEVHPRELDGLQSRGPFTEEK